MRTEAVKHGNAWKHGGIDTKAYRSWEAMKRRCFNERDPKYPRYGGRGITVCARWMDFANFFADMGERAAGLTIDRIDNDGDYEPSNCRWSDLQVQAENRSTTRLLEFNGELKTPPQWAKQLSVSPSWIYRRLKRGLSISQMMQPTLFAEMTQ